MNEKGEFSPQDPKRKKVEFYGNSDTIPDSGSICKTSHPDNYLSLERDKSPSKAISITGNLSSAMPLEKAVDTILMKESTAPSTLEVTAAMVHCATQESGLGIKEHGTKSRNIPKAKTALPRSRKGKAKQCRGLPETVLEKETPECRDLPETMLEKEMPEEDMELLLGPGESSRSKLVIVNKNSKMTGPVELSPEAAMQYKEPKDVSEHEKEPTSVEICCPSTLSELSCNGTGEPPGGDLFNAAPMDPEEIKRHEKIKRLKELLKEKEAALEMIRKNLI